METKDEGTMDPERDQLEPPSASMGLKTPSQQCPQNGETGRTTADGCLLVGVSSSLGGNTFFPDSESTTPPAASNTIFLQASRKPEDKEKCSKENKQFDPGGKGGDPPLRKAAVRVVVSFSGGILGLGARCLCSVLLSVHVCLLCFVSYHQVITFQRAGVYLGREKKAVEERNRRASIILPINPLKMAKIITTVPGSMCRNALGVG